MTYILTGFMCISMFKPVAHSQPSLSTARIFAADVVQLYLSLQSKMSYLVMIMMRSLWTLRILVWSHTHIHYTSKCEHHPHDRILHSAWYSLLCCTYNITYDVWWALGREVLFTGMVQRTLHFVLATISLRSFMTFQVGHRTGRRYERRSSIYNLI